MHCFREEFTLATKDFTYALKEARAARRAKMMHHTGNSQSETRSSKSKRKKHAPFGHANGQAPANGTCPLDDLAQNSDGGFLKHPSVMPDAPEPIEHQLLFLRGAAYLQQAVHLIEKAILNLEGVIKAPTIDGAELRLSNLENGKYGGVEPRNPEGPLGSNSGDKVRAYHAVLGEKGFRDQITSLLKKSLRDHEKFASHFDSLESPNTVPDGDISFQVDYAYTLADTKRGAPDVPPVLTTYHPLLVESMFSALICQLMLADFSALLPQFVRTAVVVDGLEGYPVFLPPRSMGQAEFMEILDRLATGWRSGTRPHSQSGYRGKSRLAIEAPPIRSPAPMSRSSSVGTSIGGSFVGGSTTRASSSSSSSRKNSLVARSSSASAIDFDTSFASIQSTSQLHTTSPFADISEDNVRSESPVPAYSPIPQRRDATHALDCARMLLTPVVKRQREKQERAAADKAAGMKKRPAPISIPLHGPRVDIVLAWLAAVHFPEMEE